MFLTPNKMARPWLSEMKSKLQDFPLKHLGRLEPIFDEHMCFEWLTQVPPSKKTNICFRYKTGTHTHTLTNSLWQTAGTWYLICCFFGRFQTVEMQDRPSWDEWRMIFLSDRAGGLWWWQKQVLGNRRVEGNQLNTHQWILRMITRIDGTNVLAFVTLSPYVIFDYEST